MRQLAFTLVLLVAVCVPGAGGGVAAQATFRTIVDRDHDNRLEYGPAEPLLLRTDLAQPRSGGSRTLLIHFAQMTDIHLVDEESPARVEFVDRIGPPYEAAYRPQSGLGPMVLDQMVRALRAEKPELVMVTGDSADNTQLNETRWFVNILDGGVVNPDSGRSHTCGNAHGLYQGVRGSGRYYEPDRSTGQDGPGYSPSERLNEAHAKRSNALRDYPGLFEEMNRPFGAIGLGVPWYDVFGNHDALVQGNVPGNAFFSSVAIGCIKVTDLSRRAWKLIEPLARGGITDEENTQIVQIIYGDFLSTISSPQKHRGLWKRVSSDPNRKLLFRKADYIRELMYTRGAPRGHGFDEANIESGEGNYSFDPKPGLRFVVLDTTAAAGPDGNLDNAQFLWLHNQLLAAESAHELVVVFAHHSLSTMRQHETGAHYGLTGSCPSQDPAAPPAPDESLLCLFERHQSVIAFVAGHTHMNAITPYARPGGGFWEIVTPSLMDWPQQARIIDLYDDHNGLIEIATHVVDHLGPPRPGKPVTSRGRLLAPAEVKRLASISRELSFNDPQADNGKDGSMDRRGTRLDRNVTLLLSNPY